MKTFYTAIAVDPKTTDAAHVNRVIVDDNGASSAKFLKEFPNLHDAQEVVNGLNATPPTLTEEQLIAMQVAEPSPHKAG